MATALLAAATLAGCHRRVNADPETTYQDIRGDLIHGNLKVARQKAEKARYDFSASATDWPMKFRLLEAEAMGLQSRGSELIALLNSPDVPYPTTGDLAIQRNLLCGLAHLRLGQAQQSDQELQQARRLTDASHSQMNGEVLRTEALVQLYRGHLPEATELARQSLDLARRQQDSFLEASDLLNLGLIALQMNHYDEMLPLLKQAADAARSIQARTIIEYASGNRGLAYFYLGDFEKALSDFREAEQEAKEIGTSDARVDWLTDAASSFYMLGDFREAKTCFEQSLSLAAGLHLPAETAEIETHLAFLLYQQGQLNLARTHDDIAIHESQISGDPSGQPEPLFLRALLAVNQPDGRDPEQMLMAVYTKSAENPSLKAQIENALAKFYVGRHQDRQADIWYRRSIHTFEAQRAAVHDEELRLPFLANGDALYRNYADFLVDSNRQDQALQLLDRARAQTLAEGLGSATQQPATKAERAIDVQAVARKVDGTIFFYSLGPKVSYLWAVMPHSTHLYRLPGQMDIEAQVRSYQKAILKSSDPLRDANQSAKNLYETLVSPAAAALPKDSRIFIIPDGVLNGLNFETLLAPGADSPHYWIEDVTISNANSIRMLSMFDTGPPLGDKKKLLLIGNPIVTGTGYENLLNAFAEIRGLEKHFQSSDRTVITQSEAIPAAYANSKPEQYSYIHFVAHGTASELSPLDSAVVLSPPPGNPDDFKLYAREIMRSPLHARLVTISACYGSGSRAYAGEGLVGLSWAFLRAGSHNVIGALWEVNDAATPLLMDRLYGAIEAGRAPDAALREAKLSLIHSSAVYRKPFYWGEFQLYAGS